MKLRNIFSFLLCMAVIFTMTGCNPSRLANTSNTNSSGSFVKSNSNSKAEPSFGASSTSAGNNLSSSVSNSNTKDTSGSWVQKAPMSTPRKWFQTAVVDGKIYAMGGSDEYDGYNHGLSTVEEYDPASDRWAKKTPMLSARLNFRTEVIDGKIYVLGGNNGKGAPSSSMEEYDPKSNKWTEKASMSVGRMNLQTEVIDEKIYAIGGIGNYVEFLSSVEEYDPKTNKWTTKSSMSVPRAQFETTVMNGKIYVMGGNSDNRVLSSVEEYNPKTNEWIKKAPMAIPRIGFQAQSISGKIYAIGGYNSGDGSTNTELSSVEEYDPKSNRWVAKKSMPTPRHDFQTKIIDGKIYAIGGSSFTQSAGTYLGSGLSAVEIYIPSDNVWLYRETMTTSRLSCQTEVLDDKIYAIGGISKTKVLSSIEVYTAR